jgi:ATP/maltotriose-dependent transcriptional regulator MalT
MSTPILATKLYIPPPRPKIVLRPHLIERLNEGLSSTPGVTLISAPAGFGKTTLVSEWVNDLGSKTSALAPKLSWRPVPGGASVDDLRLNTTGEDQVENRKSNFINRAAWISLDEGDNDPARFLFYFVAALQTLAPNIGERVLTALQAPLLPPTESLLTELLNEIATLANNFVLVLDDYHVIDSKPVDKILTFLLEHLPAQMHLVITTREDPDLPLARLRARGQLIELRVSDLRFTLSEAAEFLNRVMGLHLSAQDLAALETRTEGWIAGLQLAALSMRGQEDATSFIKSFTGSHRFVMDYLVEEVLHQQPASIQTFLLRTSILDRLCGPLCDAVLLDPSGSGAGQRTLEYLERANLFIVPLDNERHWYRYHHLFADLLRQRLPQSLASSGDGASGINDLHIRASQWYEENGLMLEAFQHAAAANDVERAERLISGDGIPRHFRGAVTAILDWLGSLPKAVLDARPTLWWRYAALLLVNGQMTGVEEKLQAAEDALQLTKADEDTRNLVGRIAAARATLALPRYDIETMFTQSRRALEYLDLNILSTRANAHWTLGTAYMFRGERSAARQALTESISLSQAAGDIFTTILATLGLANVQEADNQLFEAAETYRRILQWASDQPLQIIGEVHLGLARVLYEWNDLDGAEQHGQQSLLLERQYEKVIDRFIICEVFLARLKLARDDITGAAAMLAKADQAVRQYNFVLRMPEVAAAQVLTLLRQGNLAVAAQLAQTHNLPLIQARVYLAQREPSAALALLSAYRQQVEAKDWKDEQLKAMLLQTIALYARGEKEEALQLLGEALILAEPGSFIRLFIDEGEPMRLLILDFRSRTQDHKLLNYVDKLLAAFSQLAEPQSKIYDLKSASVEPLSQRELEVLRLIAQGLTNDEIGKRLFLALDTVKGHNRRIYDKLQVQRRTEAIARARELGLL